MPDQKPLEERKFLWEKRKFLITTIGGTVLFLIGLWQFSITARNDFAKPVLVKQLELCLQASGSAAGVSQQARDTGDEWRKGEDARAFLSLYYGELGVVEDKCLYHAMIGFKTTVFDGKQSAIPADRHALRVAFACRRMVSKNWSSGFVSLYDPDNLLESFSDLEDYKTTLRKMTDCPL